MPPDLPLFTFIFLVALGVDNNIFLMARVHEETLTHGTRVGTVRGLAVTGAVITSAGLALAGTFATLAVLPIVALTGDRIRRVAGVLIRSSSGRCWFRRSCSRSATASGGRRPWPGPYRREIARLYRGALGLRRRPPETPRTTRAGSI
jgi:hypothetical protein